MLLIIIAIGILTIIAGAIWLGKSSIFDSGGEITIFVGVALTFISVLIFIVTLLGYIKISHNDERIEIYKRENEKIETTINAMIEDFKDYEKEAYGEYKPNTDDLEVAIMHYPELRASALVQEQLRIYAENRSQIKELEVEKVDRDIAAWWLWFGGGE